HRLSRLLIPGLLLTVSVAPACGGGESGGMGAGGGGGAILDGGDTIDAGPDETPPSLQAIEFTAYDEITLTFDEAMGAPSLADFTITEKPTGMAVHGVS